MSQQLLFASLLVSAVIGAGYSVVKVSVFLWRALQKIVRLADDLTGEPAMGNMPARLGVLDRLAAIEGRLVLIDGIEARLLAVEARFLAVADEHSERSAT